MHLHLRTGSFVYQRHNEINRLIQQTLTSGEVSHVRVEPRGQYVGYGDGSPDMSYWQRNGTLVLTDASVVAARGSANRQCLMTKTGVLARGSAQNLALLALAMKYSKCMGEMLE